jgi:ABC-type antimicrobial peptide transport system permease subunit
VPAYDVQTMETFYAARATSIGAVMIRLIGGMGLMGMTLTAVGLYGLVSYTVGRRTREIGSRLAIGATSGRVLLDDPSAGNDRRHGSAWGWDVC